MLARSLANAENTMVVTTRCARWKAELASLEKAVGLDGGGFGDGKLCGVGRWGRRPGGQRGIWGGWYRGAEHGNPASGNGHAEDGNGKAASR